MRTLVVAIPQLEGKCTEKYQKMGVAAIFDGNRYLVPLNGGIATTSLRTGLAMTGNFEAERQAPIYLLNIAHTRKTDSERERVL